MDAIATLAEELRCSGFALTAPADSRDQFLAALREWGDVVGEERIALRDGAHAYVAKPGAVPLHTDHPEVDVVAWWCEQQDSADGASLLLDARPVLDELDRRTVAQLHEILLACPPLRGGPPTERFPVLRDGADGVALFCSPWLRAVEPEQSDIDALEELRAALSAAARSRASERRLRRGDVLLADNRRVLHGRRAIALDSRRVLHRAWVRLHRPLAEH